MYSRSYFPDEERITPPKNYDGTAFSESPPEKAESDTTDTSSDVRAASVSDSTEATACGGAPSIFSGLLGGLKLPSIKSLKLSDIGTEEILIIAAALFLFFSKEGDKECAIMLILLLFVT